MKLIQCLLLLMVTQCIHAATPEMLRLHKEIESLVNLRCTQHDQCRSAGVWIRPCGGFDNYLLYSSKNTDEPLLLSKLEELHRLDSEYILNNPVGSICTREQPLVSQCLRNICRNLGNDNGSITSLTWAVLNSDQPLFDDLLKSGQYNIHKHGPEAFFEAIRSNVSTEWIEYILKHGLDVSSGIGLGAAVKKKRLDLFKLLLDFGAKPKSSKLAQVTSDLQDNYFSHPDYQALLKRLIPGNVSTDKKCTGLYDIIGTPIECIHRSAFTYENLSLGTATLIGRSESEDIWLLNGSAIVNKIKLQFYEDKVYRAEFVFPKRQKSSVLIKTFTQQYGKLKHGLLRDRQIYAWYFGNYRLTMKTGDFVYRYWLDKRPDLDH
jgi:hypothetical protein